MKQIASIVFVLFFCNGFSQEKFSVAPQHYKKIHFVYTQKSNLYFDEKGIYADTVFYNIEFPTLHFKKIIHPKEKVECGFVSFADMGSEVKDKLLSLLYHENETYVATYDLEKNKTTIKAERNDVGVKKLFETVFKKSYSKFRYTVYIDYNKKTKKIDYPAITYKKPFTEVEKKIDWISDTEGSFKETKRNVDLTNIVHSDETLPKVITLGAIFENNNFGINKINTIYVTIQLESVSYE